MNGIVLDALCKVSVKILIASWIFNSWHFHTDQMRLGTIQDQDWATGHIGSMQASASRTYLWAWAFLLVTVLGFYAMLICFSPDCSEFSLWLAFVGSSSLSAHQVQVCHWPSLRTDAVPLIRSHDDTQNHPSLHPVLAHVTCFAQLQIQMPMDTHRHLQYLFLSGWRALGSTQWHKYQIRAHFHCFILRTLDLITSTPSLYAVNQNFSKPQSSSTIPALMTFQWRWNITQS